METKIGSKGQSVVLYKVEALSYTYPPSSQLASYFGTLHHMGEMCKRLHLRSYIDD